MPARTDLALECIEPDDTALPEGITRNIRKSESCTVTEISITNETAAQSIGKPCGRYVTIETPRLSGHPDDFSSQAAELSKEIAAVTGKVKRLLVIGLGNRNITPDALGPMTVSGIIPTRHLEDMPDMPPLKNVSAIAPGVLGQTGIEAAEIAEAVCSTVNPDCVIAVDALACSDISRLGRTIQISDTGISPGSGVQNRRKELSRATLGVPVTAIGVPTVTDMHTIAENITGTAPSEDMPNMMVTPRDIDELIRRTSKLIAFAINRTIQTDLSDAEIISLM